MSDTYYKQHSQNAKTRRCMYHVVLYNFLTWNRDDDLNEFFYGNDLVDTLSLYTHSYNEIQWPKIKNKNLIRKV